MTRSRLGSGSRGNLGDRGAAAGSAGKGVGLSVDGSSPNMPAEQPSFADGDSARRPLPHRRDSVTTWRRRKPAIRLPWPPGQTVNAGPPAPGGGRRAGGHRAGSVGEQRDYPDSCRSCGCPTPQPLSCSACV
jgi:hypothetical protein